MLYTGFICDTRPTLITAIVSNVERIKKERKMATFQLRR